jgi:hypothetical protein
MTKKTIEDYKVELVDKITSLVSKRNSLVLELENMQKQLKVLIEQQYSLDDTKVRITCPGCNGLGYMQGEDKKKTLCQICGGDYYMWATIFKPETPTSLDKEV